MANMREGKYNLKINNASLYEEGLYMCSFVNQERIIKDYVLQLKIKGKGKMVYMYARHIYIS